MTGSTQNQSRTRHKSLESPVRPKAHAGFGGRLHRKARIRTGYGTSLCSPPYWE